MPNIMVNASTRYSDAVYTAHHFICQRQYASALHCAADPIITACLATDPPPKSIMRCVIDSFHD